MNEPDKLDLKQAFAEYAKKELEFYKSAKKNQLYNRVMPNLKEKDKGTIEFYYNGIIIGGYIYKDTITLIKLKITKMGTEDGVEEAVKIVEAKVAEAGMSCDNQLK